MKFGRYMLRMAATLGCLSAIGATAGEREDRYARDIQPLLQKFCGECHMNGAAEGGRSFDGFETDAARLEDHELWWAVLKNVRSEVMPPHGSPRPSTSERSTLIDWIKRDIFQLDPANPDPGRVTLRRLNRVEYRNTIRDLMGVDYDTDAEFPPDDTGHGFDNVGDVLSVSPLLIEKYLLAAEQIVDSAVPRVSRVLPVKSMRGNDFVSADGSIKGERLDFYTPAEIARRVPVAQSAEYRLAVDVSVNGSFNFDPGRCRLTARLDGRDLWQREFKWEAGSTVSMEEQLSLDAGEHDIQFVLEPLTAKDEQKEALSLRLRSVRLEGPLDRAHWQAPTGYARFFPRRDPPAVEDEAGRREYAREILLSFATRAFRRPPEEPLVERLVDLACAVDAQPGRSFEDGIARAMTAVLSSPRFLFRRESPVAGSQGAYAYVDDYALASRLSYFLWSTMPDAELFELASRGVLRDHLDEQLERMLKDERSERLVRNFVGQWLQTRDIEGVSIDPLSALGLREEYDELRDKLYRSNGRFRRDQPDPNEDPEITQARERMRKLRETRDVFNADLRRDMRRETEACFTYVFRENRSVLELIDADYTFLNERLAKHYGIEGVEGEDLRRVSLPEGHVRGGILTQGTFLAVTSNPTRTSPVKRGLFILDNILGTPAPPAPAVVPELEASRDQITDHTPTLREALELHRQQPLCASCHARFDPLGLALENFTALGTWRDTDAGQPIDAAGTLITGESFTSLPELKVILQTQRRFDFYRCLSERLLTYALGRGLEATDEETLDQLVARLDAANGRCSALLSGIVQSAPFLKMRVPAEPQAAEADAPVRENSP